MLSAQTKQVNAYGKRARRVVNVTASSSGPAPGGIISIFDDLPPAPALMPLASRMKKRENIAPKPKSQLSPKPVGGKQRKRRLSPVLTPVKKVPRVAQLIKESRTQPLDNKLDGGVRQANAKVNLTTEAEASPFDASSFSSPRRPFSSFSVNVPGSPALPASLRASKSRVPSAKSIPFKLAKPSSPVVNMDIIVLDDDGQVVRKERRSSKTGVETNPVKDVPKKRARPSRAAASKAAILVESDSDPDVARQPAQPKRTQRQKALVVVSDVSDSETENAPTAPSPAPPKTNRLSKLPTVEVVIPPAPYPIRPLARPSPPAGTQHRAATPTKPKPAPPTARPGPAFQLPPSPIPRARPLTPIKGMRRNGLFDPPSPPSPSLTDFDLSLDLSELNIDAECVDAHDVGPNIPAYLLPLLEECHQEECGPHDFSSFIDSFPFDPILRDGRSDAPSELEFRKIGEASYSEVFGIADVVLKVIPLRDESAPGAISTELEEGPPPSDAQDVRKEIIVTRAMGEVYGGFVKFLKTYIVRGKYPELLLNLWDEYNETKGSESMRPDTFKLSQVYAIIVLPNGGPDLEAYSFNNPTKQGWKQACSIFWQVAKSLAHAEHLVSFEHRDLHWGQILVKNVPSQKPKLQPINVNGVKSRKQRLMMDDKSHGVQTTIIDLGLSRMDAGDGSGGYRVQWTPFDEEVFMGEGEYQFDVYRMMRDHTGDDWEGYHPLTNVMWLHYLATKLLYGKGLKAPVVRKPKSGSEAPLATSSDAFSERDCYESLLDIEQWLGSFLTGAFPAQSKAIAKTKGRRKTIVLSSCLALRDGPSCAGEVVAYGVKKGWVSATKLF
ncbi:other/Haspin protein kinase [Coprinopsis cinerea AmutBmut pab1-1]|nr:other/Haspin protein kinase [Coprinopsis cinerea AmutBmut pab1-1]